MIVFNLTCEHSHPFEGWFTSADDMEQQLQQGQISCPICDSRKISKQLSAPRLNLGATQWHAVRDWIRNTEDVGERFSEEARKIHYREAPARNIRGVSSAAEVQALLEEGIEVLPLPIPPALKENLQ